LARIEESAATIFCTARRHVALLTPAALMKLG
jgi:hypothetical protein